MQVSEQASEKVVLADHQPGASTFPGTPVRGGWVPILAKASDSERAFRIDWLCPKCGHLTAQSKSCPGCGLGVLEHPKKTEPIPKRSRDYQYRRWILEIAIHEDDRPRSMGGRSGRETPENHDHRPRTAVRGRRARVR